MLSRLPKLIGAGSLVLVCVTASAQVAELQSPLPTRVIPAPRNMTFDQPKGKAYFNSNIGSFKLMAVNENPAEGTLDMIFRGTLLVSRLDPNSSILITGNIRKEVDDKKYQRQVFFGSGRITIRGKFRSVQFFGRGLRASFEGFAIARLYGEFDQDLETGYYWYEGQTRRTPWYSTGTPLQIPASGTQKPRIKIEGRGG